MTQLRLAVVGVGAYESSRARAYLATICRLTDLYALCAICDHSQQALEVVGTRFGVNARYTDVEHMLSVEKPDVVFALVPTDGQTVIALTAVEHNCHLITEIPYALTLPFGDAIARKCQQHGVKWEVAENVWRWPNEQLKQRIVQAGMLGQITHARLWYTCGAYHGLNAIRMILDSEPKRVLGHARKLEVRPYQNYGGQPESTIYWESGVIEFEDGVTCLYELPSASGIRGNHWEIEGTDGYLSGNELVLYPDQRRYAFEEVYDQIDGERVLAAVRVGETSSDAAFDPIVWENPFRCYGISSADDVAKASILNSLHHAVVTGTEPEYGPQNARRDMETWIALRKSAESGNAWVDLPLTEPTALEQRLEAAYIDRYGGEPVGASTALLQAPFDRLSVMWTVAGWL